MFYSKNKNIKNDGFDLSSFFNELTSLIEKYGEINNLKIEVLNHIDMCYISFQIDYGNN